MTRFVHRHTGAQVSYPPGHRLHTILSALADWQEAEERDVEEVGDDGAGARAGGRGSAGRRHGRSKAGAD
ncbi:hypothetical protein [Actinomyces qiguomingii]|uniref:hypothetical protein n=1 Tax=Actinomyces qiguomingii TaxID=2057800 RepID=UPI000FFE7BC3|nr:hypothetical protein [Actinomyces qiguomingii]